MQTVTLIADKDVLDRAVKILRGNGYIVHKWGKQDMFDHYVVVTKQEEEDND